MYQIVTLVVLNVMKMKFHSWETTCQESDSDDDVELVEADLECGFLYALKKIKELKSN